MSTRRIAQLALLLLGGLAAVTAVGAATVSAQPPANQIHGHWLIEGTPDPASGLAPFVNVAALTPGGQMVNVDPGVGTSVGGWRRIKGREYAVTFTGFAPGGLRYVVRATATLSPGGQQLSGPYYSEFFDPAGTLVFAYGGTVAASRQAVVPY
jgi:hypothetical protein